MEQVKSAGLVGKTWLREGRHWSGGGMRLTLQKGDVEQQAQGLGTSNINSQYWAATNNDGARLAPAEKPLGPSDSESEVYLVSYYFFFFNKTKTPVLRTA